MRSRRCQLSIGMNAAARPLHALDAAENPEYTPASASVRPAQRARSGVDSAPRRMSNKRRGSWTTVEVFPASSTGTLQARSTRLMSASFCCTHYTRRRSNVIKKRIIGKLRYHSTVSQYAPDLKPACLRTGQPFAVISCSTGSATTRSGRAFAGF